MRKLFLLGIVATLVSCQQKKVDVIIRGATVYDGSGSAPVVTDVAIAGDTIAMIGDLKDVTATTSYDVPGFVLAPGFIDTHSHHDWGLNKSRDALAVVSQGVTTIVAGQDGGSNTPLKDYFQLLTDSPAAVNVASYTGHNTLRDMVMKKDFKRKATQEEVDSMLLLMKADMDAGALGLSTGLEYDPGIYSAEDEVMTLSKALPEYEGRYISHMRSEDRYFWKALNEIINIGKETKVPVQVSHFKLAMTNLWGKADSTLALLDAARANGINITADIYPYTYWHSTIRVLFPSRNFKDLKEAELVLKEITTPEGVIFSNYEPNPEYNGKSLMEVSKELKLSPAKTLIELIDRLDKCDAKGEECSGSIVATSMEEKDVARLMQWQYTNICSDGSSSGRHPRGFGAFTRVLKHYVREEKALTMEQAIYKMTALAASNTGIQRRGMIRQGYYADLVLFDPQTVGDESTIQEPQKISSGIEHVWVNGTEVFTKGTTKGVYPGRVIRRGNN
ncbi:MAG TPA: D-aminoacylase [Cyclobacteriaceae bacterium]|nr:D-aminoacylase [Cyclobacteriaceae bacterium]